MMSFDDMIGGRINSGQDKANKDLVFVDHHKSIKRKQNILDSINHMLKGGRSAKT